MAYSEIPLVISISFNGSWNLLLPTDSFLNLTQAESHQVAEITLKISESHFSVAHTMQILLQIIRIIHMTIWI